MVETLKTWPTVLIPFIELLIMAVESVKGS